MYFEISFLWVTIYFLENVHIKSPFVVLFYPNVFVIELIKILKLMQPSQDSKYNNAFYDLYLSEIGPQIIPFILEPIPGINKNYFQLCFENDLVNNFCKKTVGIIRIVYFVIGKILWSEKKYFFQVLNCLLNFFINYNSCPR